MIMGRYRNRVGICFKEKYHSKFSLLGHIYTVVHKGCIFKCIIIATYIHSDTSFKSNGTTRENGLSNEAKAKVVTSSMRSYGAIHLPLTHNNAGAMERS